MFKRKIQKTKIQSQFEKYEHVFSIYKNALINENNKYPVGNPNRTENDLSEIDKANRCRSICE